MRSVARSRELVAPCRAAWIGCLWLVACVQTHPPSLVSSVEGAFRIVALGDSYASGQGAPDAEAHWWTCDAPRWDDRRCNRSNNAATAQAVELLREQGHAVEYASLACSGAKIEEGLIGGYAGSEPPAFPIPPELLPPQVEALEELVATDGVDAVTLSIGGNDILFEFIVVDCLATPSCDLSQPIVDHHLAALPGRLRSLADALARVPLASERIFLVGYPDPTRDADDSPCDRKPFGDALAGVTKRESEWIAQYVLPRLNRTLCEAATEHGWTYVGDAAARFEEHGWCSASQRWINTVEDSSRMQHHYRGAVHPNRRGYRDIGEVIAASLAPVLAGQPPTASPCPDLPPAPSPPAP
jgi:lysophospholipase L1-like esterase